MANLQQQIKDKAGTRTPFTVPEGYFDSFARTFMNNLPATSQENVGAPLVCASNAAAKKTIHSSLFTLHLKRLALAACALVAIFSVSVYLVNSNPSPANAATLQQYSLSEEDYIDLVADYAMMDNSDIYACLSEE